MRRLVRIKDFLRVINMLPPRNIKLLLVFDGQVLYIRLTVLAQIDGMYILVAILFLLIIHLCRFKDSNKNEN